MHQFYIPHFSYKRRHCGIFSDALWDLWDGYNRLTKQQIGQTCEPNKTLVWPLADKSWYKNVYPTRFSLWSCVEVHKAMYLVQLSRGGDYQVPLPWTALLGGGGGGGGGRFKNAYELLTPKALEISRFHENFIFQCMGKIFCVEFQRYPLKFHTKYLTHTSKYMRFIHMWKFQNSLI